MYTSQFYFTHLRSLTAPLELCRMIIVTIIRSLANRYYIWGRQMSVCCQIWSFHTRVKNWPVLMPYVFCVCLNFFKSDFVFSVSLFLSNCFNNCAQINYPRLADTWLRTKFSSMLITATHLTCMKLPFLCWRHLFPTPTTNG